jgi:methyl-accepting chemotaxis protein
MRLNFRWKWKFTINLQKKLYASFSVIILLMSLTVLTSWWILNQTLVLSEKIEHKNVPSTVLYLSLIDKQGDMMLNIYKFLSGGLEKAGAEQKDNFQKNYKEFTEILDELIPLESDNAVDKQRMNLIKATVTEFYDLVDLDVFSLIEDGVYYEEDIPYAYESLEYIEDSLLNTLEKELNEAAAEEVEGATLALTELHGKLTMLKKTLIGLTIVASILSLLIAYRLSTTITRRVSAVANLAEKVASGDLSSQPIEDKSSDELAALAVSVNTMQVSLQTLLSSISSVSDEVKQVSVELDNSTEKMLDGAQQQASKASMIATASEELTLTINEVAQQSVLTSDIAQEAGQSAQEGGMVINEMVTSTQEVSQQMNSMSDNMQTLDQRSDEIGSVIKVIGSIADQTNLLALNAAIEAARAGEYGRGFAVVADEVRALAARTSDATKEVTDLVNAIQTGTSDVMAQSQASASLVQDGVSLSENAGNALKEIVSSSNNVQSMIQTIATATEEQTAVTKEIAQDIAIINDIAAHSVTLTENSSERSHELRDKVTQLEALLAKFKLA